MKNKIFKYTFIIIFTCVLAILIGNSMVLINKIVSENEKNKNVYSMSFEVYGSVGASNYVDFAEDITTQLENLFETHKSTSINEGNLNDDIYNPELVVYTRNIETPFNYFHLGFKFKVYEHCGDEVEVILEEDIYDFNQIKYGQSSGDATIDYKSFDLEEDGTLINNTLVSNNELGFYDTYKSQGLINVKDFNGATKVIKMRIHGLTPDDRYIRDFTLVFNSVPMENKKEAEIRFVGSDFAKYKGTNSDYIVTKNTPCFEVVDKETGNVIVSSVNGENLADCGGKIRIILKKFIDDDVSALLYPIVLTKYVENFALGEGVYFCRVEFSGDSVYKATNYTCQIVYDTPS